MVFERNFVFQWNRLCRVTKRGRPIYNFKIYANFMGLSEETGAKINEFWHKYLPLRGTNIQIDVLNNRRHVCVVCTIFIAVSF